MDEVIPLFPTPVMRSAGVVPRAVVDGLAQHFSGLALQTNNSSANLSHTQMLRPSDSPLLVDVAALVTPKLVDFGALLFGERLPLDADAALARERIIAKALVAFAKCRQSIVSSHHGLAAAGECVLARWLLSDGRVRRCGRMRRNRKTAMNSNMT